MNIYVIMLIQNLLLTLAFELIAALIMKVRGTDLIAVAIVNIITNPVVNFLFFLLNALINEPAVLAVLFLLEAAAVACEARLYSLMLKNKEIRPLKLSLICNAASFFTGGALSLLLSLYL